MDNKNNKEIEKEILQYLYDKEYIDFTGDEESLVLHANLTGKGLIDIFKAGSLSKEKDVLKIIEEEMKIDEDMPILKEHIEQIKLRIIKRLEQNE